MYSNKDSLKLQSMLNTECDLPGACNQSSIEVLSRIARKCHSTKLITYYQFGEGGVVKGKARTLKDKLYSEEGRISSSLES